MAEFYVPSNNSELGSTVLSKPAEEFVNDPNIETLWAMKAFQHAQVYFNLLCSVDLQFLKLTPHDDKIYSQFRQTFPALNVDCLNEDMLKSASAKEQWRPFCNSFDFVEDFNFATLLRLNPSLDYSEENSILVPRIQFYAIEIARNREGINKSIREKFKGKIKE